MQRFKAHADFRYNGIDRVDSSKGYLPNNVVACCTTCNRMKLDHSRNEFITHLKSIIAHLECKPHLNQLERAA